MCSSHIRVACSFTVCKHCRMWECAFLLEYVHFTNINTTRSYYKASVATDMRLAWIAFRFDTLQYIITNLKIVQHEETTLQ